MHQFKETARQDPYRSQSKPEGTPRCPICQSTSIRGRWLSPLQMKQMQLAVLATSEMKCPACKQLEEHYALGVIELHGETWKQKRDLVLNTIHNTESVVRNRNDQERILWIKEEEVTKIYVALPELARQIGRELSKSFHGHTEYKRSDEEPFLRVRWNSDPVEAKENHKSKAFRRRSD